MTSRGVVEVIHTPNCTPIAPVCRDSDRQASYRTVIQIGALARTGLSHGVSSGCAGEFAQLLAGFEGEHVPG